MDSLRQSVRRPLGVLLLASLVLVPIALSGHAHARQATHPCAACLVTQHAPAVTAPAVPAFTPQFNCFLPLPTVALAVPRAGRTPRTGRAPPLARLASA